MMDASTGSTVCVCISCPSRGIEAAKAAAGASSAGRARLTVSLEYARTASETASVDDAVILESGACMPAGANAAVDQIGQALSQGRSGTVFIMSEDASISWGVFSGLSGDGPVGRVAEAFFQERPDEALAMSWLRVRGGPSVGLRDALKEAAGTRNEAADVEWAASAFQGSESAPGLLCPGAWAVSAHSATECTEMITEASATSSLAAIRADEPGAHDIIRLETVAMRDAGDGASLDGSQDSPSQPHAACVTFIRMAPTGLVEPAASPAETLSWAIGLNDYLSAASDASTTAGELQAVAKRVGSSHAVLAAMSPCLEACGAGLVVLIGIDPGADDGTSEAAAAAASAVSSLRIADRWRSALDMAELKVVESHPRHHHEPIGKMMKMQSSPPPHSGFRPSPRVESEMPYTPITPLSPQSSFDDLQADAALAQQQADAALAEQQADAALAEQQADAALAEQQRIAAAATQALLGTHTRIKDPRPSVSSPSASNGLHSPRGRAMRRLGSDKHLILSMSPRVRPLNGGMNPAAAGELTPARENVSRLDLSSRDDGSVMSGLAATIPTTTTPVSASLKSPSQQGRLGTSALGASTSRQHMTERRLDVDMTGTSKTFGASVMSPSTSRGVARVAPSQARLARILALEREARSEAETRCAALEMECERLAYRVEVAEADANEAAEAVARRADAAGHEHTALQSQVQRLRKVIRSRSGEMADSRRHGEVLEAALKRLREEAEAAAAGQAAAEAEAERCRGQAAKERTKANRWKAALHAERKQREESDTASLRLQSALERAKAAVMEANAETAEVKRLLHRAQARARTRDKEADLQRERHTAESPHGAGDSEQEEEQQRQQAGSSRTIRSGSAGSVPQRGDGDGAAFDEDASALELLARDIGETDSLDADRSGLNLLSPSNESRVGSTAAWSARAKAMREDRVRLGVPATPPLWAKLKKLDGAGSGSYVGPSSTRRPGSYTSNRGIERRHAGSTNTGGGYATSRRQHGRVAMPLGSPAARRTLSSPSAHGSGAAGVQAGSWVAGLRPDGPVKQSSGVTRRQSGRSRFGVRALSARKPSGGGKGGGASSLLDDDPFVQAVADY